MKLQVTCIQMFLDGEHFIQIQVLLCQMITLQNIVFSPLINYTFEHLIRTHHCYPFQPSHKDNS